MGEAKRRGTLEQRKAESVLRKQEEARLRAIAREERKRNMTREDQVALATLLAFSGIAK